jgi:DNA transformation protein
MAKSRSRTSRLIPMRVSEGFKSFVLDQLEELGDVTPKAMFGGVGLYLRDVFFGIMAADILYLKVDDTNRMDYERAGSSPFMPYAHRSVTMGYWAVPVGVLENASELAAWVRKAVDAANRARSSGRGSRTTRRRRR